MGIPAFALTVRRGRRLAAQAIAVAVLPGWLIFRESMPAHKIVAVVLILAGVILMAWR